MLRTNFTKEMTNLTMLTADEQAGIVLTLVIIAQLDEGRELLCVNFDPDAPDSLPDPDDVLDIAIIDDECVETEESQENGTDNTFTPPKCSFTSFLCVLEMMLSFHAWYKSTEPIDWTGDVSKEQLRNSIRVMLSTITKVLPRKTGFGWRLQKFHEHLHIPDDVDRFGSPKNFAGLDIWCEYHLNKKIYRSHPNYRGGGMWMDWCIIGRHRCSSDTRKERSDRVAGILTAYPPSHYPAKIFGFFKNRKNEWMSIVQSCITKENSNEDSCITERWYLEYENRAVRSVSNEIVQTDIVTYITTPVLRVTPCGNIIDRVYVVEETQGVYESITDDHSCLVVLVKKRSQWKKYFTYLT
jgi:hypothetical protein